ncbi:MAG: glycosyltransferase family 4 protein [Flavobacteriaceae bacterium]|jgi:glycosyltransferase involved in cell wall biosynthesis|nr:glycosyltransferase family 4 protein [Flavobacteriaceae bacterium]
MKIGFDAKRLFHNNTGLGNYSRDLVRILHQYFPTNEYILFNPKPKVIPFFSENKNGFQIISPKGLMRKLHFIWRTYCISKEPIVRDLNIYHGLSGEIPTNIPVSVKKVVTIHDLIFERYPHLYSFWDRKAHFKKFKYATEHADAIVAISEQTKADIIQYLKVEPTKIKVIYQGCAQAFKEEYSIEDLEQTRQKYKLPKEFVLNVGTIEERKNALSLVKAIKDIDTTLVLIGRKTKYTTLLEDYIEQNNIKHKVIFLQGITLVELAHIYQLATIFAYPSIFEGFGIPIIEALYSGTSVITTNSGVFPEAGGPNSVYINETDSNAIKEAITKLLEDPILRKSIEDKGKQFVQKFNDAEIAKQWMALYNNLIPNN